jgi:branched-chain amino acid transport system substrate-binding protein
MLVEDAVKLNKKRWALIYPNYEYGQSAIASFKALMGQKQPGIEFVVEQAAPLGKIDAGAVTQAVSDANPDAIFNVTFGADLQKFVREGETRGLFKERPVFSLLGGEPEYLDPLKDEAPVGWYVTGYPWRTIDTPEHKAFINAYRAKFSDYPRLGSVVGYATLNTIGAALKKAGGVETEKLLAAMDGLQVMTPFGKIMFRPLDHQSTMGAYVGRTAVKEGKGVMVDWRYEPGDKHLPPDAVVRSRRPSN